MLKGKGKDKKGREDKLQDRSKYALQNPSVRRVSQSFMASRTHLDSKGRLHGVSKGPRRIRDDEHREGEDGHEDWGTAPQLVKPDDQLELNEAELKEEFTRVLTANNPHTSTNIVRFSHKEQAFKPIASIDQLAIHFVLDSNLLHKDSDEAQRQLNKQEDDSGGEEQEGEEDGDEQEDDGKEDREKEDDGGKKGKKLRNQFNFSERASQTYNNPSRERGTITEPPPCVNFSGVVNQMEIYDAYLEEIAKQEKAKEKKGSKSGGDKGKEEQPKKSTGIELQSDDITRISRSSKVMERMVNQNTFDEIAQDFKYYDDPADDYKEKEGTLLPLWRFRYDKANKMSVTSLSWNQKYWDMFAVGHGSYDFSSQVGGMICFHSLKNPTFPEYVYPAHTGVLCLDIHPEHPSLIAVGFYDGAVAVYNLQRKGTSPIFRSTPKTGKHTDPVWQVSWQKNNFDGNLNFMSISSDGRVVTWTIVKNELQYEDTMKLTLPDLSAKSSDGKTYSSGTALCVSPHADHLYIVGTEEGKIYKCSKAYKDHYLDTYEAHHMAIHALRWSPFHAKVFASCGADWTVKIWDHTRKDPMFSFDMNSVVGDMVWSPFASTVFTAVTAEGKVYVYDMSINKYEPLCVQAVSQKKQSKLTHIAFNPVHPIILVGDDRGTILSLKLSPNLRKALKEKNRTNETECAKMDKLISFVCEPLLEKSAQ